MNGGALVVGEALIDAVVDARGVTRHPGGSPANVALGLARLGVATRLHTAIGDDEDGRLIRNHLADSGVTLTAESETGATTSNAVATLADDGSATYEFALSWNPRGLEELGAPVVIHVGSLGASLEPGCEVTSDIIGRGRAGGALITFDPNIRVGLVQDANRTRERAMAFARASDLVKLSDEDAEFLFPGRPLEEVLDLLVDGGAAVVGITRGSRGALLASGSGRVAISPVVTPVADTVGAGDSFMAALIRSLVFEGAGWDGRPISQERLETVGSTVARAAAITVSRPGADLPHLHELTTHHEGEMP